MDPSDTIQSIKIVADEGQDPVPGYPDLFGVSILDNIDVNGVLVGIGPAATPPPPPGGGGGDDEDDGQGEDHDHNCFHFNGNWSHHEKSRLSYSDRSQKLKFVATGGVRDIHSTGPKCVGFAADGKVNKKPGYTATFEACDRSGPTAIGTFSITITGPGGFHYEKTSFAVQGQAEGSRLAQEGIPPKAAARPACERGRAAGFSGVRSRPVYLVVRFRPDVPPHRPATACLSGMPHDVRPA